MTISDEHRALIGKLKPVSVPDTPCLDCEPDVKGTTVTHAPMCPVSICIDDVTAADRAWFDEHPFADYYRRPVTWGEGAELITHDPGLLTFAKIHHFEVRGYVRVERVQDDVRLRRFNEVYFVIVPDPGAEAEVVRAKHT